MKGRRIFWCLWAVAAAVTASAAPRCVSGVYPSLAYWNDEGECGTGAVVPWAGSLWVITYGPHCPVGGSDRLHRISAELTRAVCPESVGGTHANRMIHRETRQLVIGPYVIGETGAVRTVPIHMMPGRLTGTARHVTDPAHKVYVTDMEEALYELDLRDLSTFTRIRDGHNADYFTNLFARLCVQPPAGWNEAEESDLFGYHGKGTCSGFGKVFYSNNGWFTPEAMRDPTIPAGALAEWRPDDRQWTLIRTNQFTEVTTKDGVYGNEHPDRNVIWAMGWDHKSLILTVTDDGKTWHDYRLPKGSHSYDGAHGWNTEWPRIREIGDRENLLATMHGTFWRFPASFGPKNAKGIRPYSNYLKVIGDFCEWKGKVVFGCDDSARNEFLNKRRAKGEVGGPESSNSNLWFVDPKDLDTFGPALGRGSVWHEEPVRAGTRSDAYLLAGYDRRTLYVTGGLDFDLEVDANGDGTWRVVADSAGSRSRVGPAGLKIVELSGLAGEWVRLVAKGDSEKVTAFFNYANEDRREAKPDKAFEGLCSPGRDGRIGWGNYLRSGPADGGLHLRVGSRDDYFELDGELAVVRTNVTAASRAGERLVQECAFATQGVTNDAASVLVVDDDGRRWRLPRSRFGHVPGTRVCREVCTERDLLHVSGTFYELPAENAGGFAMIRPVSSAPEVTCFDYATWRGLFVMSGLDAAYCGDNPHLAREAGLWLGVADDLWKLGKPRGEGGPWFRTPVCPGEPSDPYLMTGFDRKQLTLEASAETAVTVEIDVTGRGTWAKLGKYELKPGVQVTDDLSAIRAYWVRAVADRAALVTVQFLYR